MAAARKVMVTGASGLLGRQICAVMAENGWEVTGLAYSRASGSLVKVDIRDNETLSQVFDQYRPSVVIHSAAERRPDEVKKDENKARHLNVKVTENITALCRENQCYMIYISTDYVFDGTSPPYKPHDKPNPLNTYGQTKLDGELATLMYPNSSVVRVPILYGPVENLDESAVTILFKAFYGTDSSPMSDFERRYPTHTRDVAKFISKLSDKCLIEPSVCSRVWHFSNSECLTKYGMSLLMGKVFGLSTDHLVPVREPSKGTLRPYNNQFDMSETLKHFSLDFVSFEDGIRDALHPFSELINRDAIK